MQTVRNNLIRILRLTTLGIGLSLLVCTGYFYNKFNQAYQTCSVFQDEDNKFSRVMFSICDNTTKAIDAISRNLPEKYHTNTNKKFIIKTLEEVSNEVYPVLKYIAMSIVSLITALLSLVCWALLRRFKC
ncbi:hypothetical protein M1446_00300 [Candidatus Dependentiae bacterium]|nr:hypothetical protein [Candidatus Dependentiae bacterium]